MKSDIKGQVWVETVIYTLIALTIIGLFLSFAKPKIEEIQDKSIVEQSVVMLEDINSVIISMIQGGAGNQRAVEIGIKKGNLKVDSTNDQLVFTIEGRYTYTEPGESVQVGNILASTKKINRISEVTLISNYSMYNITYNGGEEAKIISKSPVPYKLLILNKGTSGGKSLIDMTLS